MSEYRRRREEIAEALGSWLWDPDEGVGHEADLRLETNLRYAAEAILRGLKIPITEGAIDAFKRRAHPVPLEPNVRPALAAFLRELGFEVVE